MQVFFAAALVLLCSRAAAAAVASPSPQLQAIDGVTQQLYVLPAEDAPVQLQTHLVYVAVSDGGNGLISVFTDAEYRIENAAEDPVTLPLLVFAGRGSASAQEVSLTANGQILALRPSADGGFAGEVDLEAEAQASLRLRYRVTVQGAPLVTVRYAPSVLRRWPGAVSTRVEFSLPDAIARESWTRVAPDSWSYAVSGPDDTAIKWLYDSTIPDEEYVVQFVAPDLWPALNIAPGAAEGDSQAAAFLERGNLYRRLAEAEAADEAVSERFAAQAIAAYTAGVQRANASNEERAQMHIGLASLYRSRAAQPVDNSVLYSALMVDETASALTRLGPEDSRRAELMRWLDDGLRIVFADAQARRDWQQAAGIVEQMTSLPAGTVDAALLAEAQQMVLVQQALQLLQRGEQDAAEALAGAQLNDETAMPPLELRPLFASWQITVTAKPESVAIDARAAPFPGRETEAQSKFAELATRIGSLGQAYSVSVVDNDADSNRVGVWLEAPSPVDGAMLASAVPAGADWALLRTALAQLDPRQTERSLFLLREAVRSQPMDLRSAGDQWAAMALNLDREADRISTGEPAGDAESLLHAAIMAANYRNTAETWRSLASDSWLLFQFAPGDEEDGRAHAWYATSTSPPMTYSVQTQSLDMNLVAGIAALSLALVAGLSGLLWWLM